MTTKPKLKKIPLPEGWPALPEGSVNLGHGNDRLEDVFLDHMDDLKYYCSCEDDEWDEGFWAGSNKTGFYAAPADSAIARKILGEPAKPVTKRKAEKKAPALRKLQKNVKPGTKVVCVERSTPLGCSSPVIREGSINTIKLVDDDNTLILEECKIGYWRSADNFRLAPAKPAAKKAKSHKPAQPWEMPASNQAIRKFGMDFCRSADTQGIALPDWLPALPPVPAGYDRWEPRGEEFEIGPLCVYGCASEGYAEFRTVRAGSEPFWFASFYIEAVRDEKQAAAPSVHDAINMRDMDEWESKAAGDAIRSLFDDPVNRPSHYTQGGVECIDAIQSALSPEEFRGYLRGCAMKYLWRGPHKGNYAQDLAKAKWYLDRLAETIEKENP